MISEDEFFTFQESRMIPSLRDRDAELSDIISDLQQRGLLVVDPQALMSSFDQDLEILTQWVSANSSNTEVHYADEGAHSA